METPCNTTTPLSHDAFLEVYFGEFIKDCAISVAQLDKDGTVLHSNEAFRTLCKRKGDEDACWKLTEALKPESSDALLKVLAQCCGKGEALENPISIEFKGDDSVQTDGAETQTTSIYITCINTDKGGPIIIAHLVDTTEQKNLEIHFAHSQKMQAVGQLAGGVAHDFNNLLTAMIGFCDLLLMRHPAGDPSFADIMQIKQNANRAANLVRQLLAFSRRQTLQPKVLELTDVLAELSHLIRRLIGENIELDVMHGRDIGRIKVDQGQLEQVIINLAVNARDAMLSTGGTLTIRTQDITINDANHPEKHMVSPAAEARIDNGSYVQVDVVDTGCGIPHDLIQQIFEPFFSTKEVGAGTGLGLSTVYGIVKQTGGFIYVSSKQEQGTTFSIFFPRYEETPGERGEGGERQAATDLTGSGTILLVEDETPVRNFAARALSNKGYTVLEADSGETALDVIAESGDEIDIIVSDVIMPGMTGPDMVSTVLEKHPTIKVIFISGYGEDAFVDTYGSERAFNFLPKPFTLKQLASKVKEVLEKTEAA